MKEKVASKKHGWRLDMLAVDGCLHKRCEVWEPPQKTKMTKDQCIDSPRAKQNWL